jgi:squalene-associated FAD-dependent desaturase
MRAARIGVVGGGLAGMAAALAAADGGAEVVLFERRPVLGGLTASIVHNGLSFDNGQHVFLRCCTAYRSFIDRIGATGQVFLQDRLDVPVLAPGGARASIKRSGLPAPAHLAVSLGTYRHLSLVERVRLVRPALALGRLDPDDASLDAASFGDWLTGRRQSKRAIDRLWNLIALPTINVAAGEASLGLATKVFRVGLLDRSDAGDIGWSRVPLGELHGTIAARALQAAGVETELGSPVGPIGRSPLGAFVLSAGPRKAVVDAVILATPLRVSASIGAPLGAVGSAREAERLGTSPIVNVHLVLDRKVTDLPLAACVDSPVQFVFDRTVSSGVRSGQCLAISLSAADDYITKGSPALVAMFFAALGELFPAARQARLVDALVTREKAATFRAVPGTRAFRPQTSTDVPGVFLAGASCDTGWPATMEGAVRSGRQAATQALTLLAGAGAGDPRQLEGVGT